MGNKKSKTTEPVDSSIAVYKNTNSPSSRQNKRGSESNIKAFNEISNSKRESEAIDLFLSEKNSILKNGIQLKAKEQMEKGINKQPWVVLEKIKFDLQKVVEIISCDLSNSKVYEMLCNNLTTAPYLEELILVNCNLNQFPKFLPFSLKKLDLRENLIQSASFSGSFAIVYLDLSSNHLLEIPENLPTQLAYLFLQRNQIEVADKSSFEVLDSLLTLNLSGNKIENVGFTIRIFASLFELNLSFNKIKKLNHDFFYPGKNLINFSLSNNPLIELDNSIGEMNKLERLDLRATKLKKLPPGLSEIMTLNNLLLENVFLEDPPMYVVKKGFEEIMRYLKKKHVVEPVKKIIPEENLEGIKSIIQETNDAKDMEDENVTEEIRTSEVSRQNRNTRTDIPRLYKDEFKKVAQWLNFNLNTADLNQLKFFLVTVINDTESDIDKSFFTFNAILQIFSQYIIEVTNGARKFEISASSAYFLGRIGEYPMAVNFLNSVGFKLVSKPFIGLVLTLKGKKVHYDLVKKYKHNLEVFLRVFKNSRMQEQFVPDYFFREELKH